CMRHAMRAYIAGNKFPLKSELGHKLRVLVARRETACIYAVGYNENLAAIDTARDQIVAKVMRDRHDGARASIEKELELLEKIKHSRRPHGADGPDRFRPDVAQFEDPGPPLEKRGHERRDRREEL